VFIAVDLGAESGRICVGRLGDKVTLRETYRFPNVPVRVGQGLYWDVLRLWNDILEGIADTLRNVDGKVESLGFDSWGVSFALIDKYGELLSNPRHYRDKRVEPIMEVVLQKISREEIYHSTGIQFMPINSLYHLYALKLQDPTQLEAADCLLMIPDLFNYWATGRKMCEYTNATTTQFFDVRRHRWAEKLLEKLDLPTSILPSIVDAGTILGNPIEPLSRVCQKELKIAATATHDTASAVVASPLTESSDIYISSGTWCLLGMEVDEPLITRESMEYNLTNEGGAFGKVRLLKNIMGLWLVQELRRSWMRQGMEYSYSELTEAASKAKAFKCIIDVDNSIFLAPEDMVQAINSFCEATSQEKPENVGEYVRVALEGLALKYRYYKECLERLTGSSVKNIRIVGGGSKNWLLNQFTADATGCSVSAGPIEATSLGNIMVQASALGYVKGLREIRDIVRISVRLEEYEPSKELDWDSPFEKLNELLDVKIT